MSPLNQLKALLANKYFTEDGEEFNVELLPGMDDSEIESFRKSLPNSFLPNDIEELVRYSKGFTFDGLDEIKFTAFREFGFEEFFPNSIQLAGDGFGNFWILDVDSKGNWGSVYYVCHDPTVIVKHSDNLAEFIDHVSDFGINGSDSHLDRVHERIVMGIWRDKVGIMGRNQKDYDFPQDFMRTLPSGFLIADLTNVPNGTGFNWAKYGVNNKIIRYKDQPIWIMEKNTKQSLLARLFGSPKYL